MPNAIDEIINGVPMFEMRMLAQAIGKLSRSIHPMEDHKMADTDAAAGYLLESEKNFYRWMNIIAGQPGCVLAANIYADVNYAFNAAIACYSIGDEEPTQLYGICDKLDEYFRVLHRMIVIHYTLNDAEPPPPPKKFRVALSFAGANRPIIEQVADMLALRFGTTQILYDNYHSPIWAQANLDTLLPPLYMTESDLNAVFICKHYAERPWCGLEMRYIRQMIMDGDTKRIIFFRFDDTKIPGLLPLDGYMNVVDMRPIDITKAILTRYDHDLIATASSP